MQNGIWYNEARTMALVKIELYPDLHLVLGQVVKVFCKYSKCYRGVTWLFVDYGARLFSAVVLLLYHKILWQCW